MILLMGTGKHSIGVKIRKYILLTLQVRRATIIAREFIRVVRRATIVALLRRSLFTSISRGLRKQLKAVLQELVAAAFF